MKTIKDLTSEHINKIYSIIIGKERTAGSIEWTPEHNFVIAVFKKEKSLDERYDFVEMGIQINENLEVRHVWNYTTKNGTAISNEPLYNHHKITKYLIGEGFDVG